MKCIFVNRIIDRSSSYDMYNNANNENLYIDKKNEKNEEIEQKLFNLIKNKECEFVIYVIYKNNQVIGQDLFEVVEISIYKLLIDNELIKRKYIYTTTNKYYIQYLLSVNGIALDNNDPTDYYDFMRSSEFVDRLLKFIGIFFEDKEIESPNCNKPIKFLNETYKICFSNAYKRLQDKAQVFTSAKGDHYRNRLIHTNEVVVISLIILNKIKDISPEPLNNIDNETVTAIALGHDIGHTPFGHQGERTLNEIIKSDEIDIIKNSGKILYEDMGGFKHNIQSLRILTRNYDDDMNYDGSSISPEILEGILKHTRYNYNDIVKMIDEKYLAGLNIGDGDKERATPPMIVGDSYQNREIVCNSVTGVPIYMQKDFEYIYSNTYLSGEIVAFADEIAQRCSDIEDAIRSKTISFEEIIECLAEKGYGEITNGINSEKYNEKVNLKLLSKNIIDYYTTELASALKDGACKHIYFGRRAYNFNRIISEYIKNKLIANSEISRFDSMGNEVISKIFKSYYRNPRLLNIKVIERIFIEMLNNQFLKNNAVYFSEMDKEYINDVIKNYLDISSRDTLLLKYFRISLRNESNENDVLQYFKNIDELQDINNKELCQDYYSKEFSLDVIRNNIKNIDESAVKELEECFAYFKDAKIITDNSYMIRKLISYEQQKIIIRAICDYISGMTDTFALSEYNNLSY